MERTLFNRSGKLCGSETYRRAALCTECMSETCLFNPEGVCVFPLLYGHEAEVTDDGCLDWMSAEESVKEPF